MQYRIPNSTLEPGGASALSRVAMSEGNMKHK